MKVYESLGFEMVSALMAGTLFEWMDRRWTNGQGDYLYKELFCNGRSSREAVGRAFVQSFAETVKGMRITAFPTCEHMPRGDKASEGTPACLLTFALGRADGECVVSLQVVLHNMKNPPLLGLRKHDLFHWGAWQPSRYNAIVCSEHPDKTFDGRVIFGRLAFCSRSA